MNINEYKRWHTTIIAKYFTTDFYYMSKIYKASAIIYREWFCFIHIILQSLNYLQLTAISGYWSSPLLFRLCIFLVTSYLFTIPKTMKQLIFMKFVFVKEKVQLYNKMSSFVATISLRKKSDQKYTKGMPKKYEVTEKPTRVI